MGNSSIVPDPVEAWEALFQAKPSRLWLMIRSLSAVVAWIGLVCSTISFLSSLRSLQSFWTWFETRLLEAISSLTEIFAAAHTVMNAYRQLVYPPMEIIFDAFQLHIPDIAKDVISIVLMYGFLIFRMEVGFLWFRFRMARKGLVVTRYRASESGDLVQITFEYIRFKGIQLCRKDRSTAFRPTPGSLSSGATYATNEEDEIPY